MQATNTKDSVLTINHWSTLNLFAGVFSCCFGGAWLFGLAILISLWKPGPIVPMILGALVYLLIFAIGGYWVLVGLKLICGPEGVKIDMDQKTVCICRRTLFLKITQTIFNFEQLKHIKIHVREKPGKFGPGFNVFSVIAGEAPDEVELDYSFDVSEAKALAKRVAEFSGLPFLE